MATHNAQRATRAERMRHRLARQSVGVVRVSLDLAPAGIAELVAAGSLSAAARANATAVRKAFVRAAVAGGLAADT
jgi:hypothetical protein